MPSQTTNSKTSPLSLKTSNYNPPYHHYNHPAGHHNHRNGNVRPIITGSGGGGIGLASNLHHTPSKLSSNSATYNYYHKSYYHRRPSDLYEDDLNYYRHRCNYRTTAFYLSTVLLLILALISISLVILLIVVPCPEAIITIDPDTNDTVVMIQHRNWIQRHQSKIFRWKCSLDDQLIDSNHTFIMSNSSDPLYEIPSESSKHSSHHSDPSLSSPVKIDPYFKQKPNHQTEEIIGLTLPHEIIHQQGADLNGIGYAGGAGMAGMNPFP